MCAYNLVVCLLLLRFKNCDLRKPTQFVYTNPAYSIYNYVLHSLCKKSRHLLCECSCFTYYNDQESYYLNIVTSKNNVFPCDFADEYITMKQVAAVRFRRNHRLMMEIFSDVCVPDPRTGLYHQSTTVLIAANQTRGIPSLSHGKIL